MQRAPMLACLGLFAVLTAGGEGRAQTTCPFGTPYLNPNQFLNANPYLCGGGIPNLPSPVGPSSKPPQIENPDDIPPPYDAQPPVPQPPRRPPISSATNPSLPDDDAPPLYDAKPPKRGGSYE
jgi:hypothetical protein